MSYNLPNQIIDASGNMLGVGTNFPEYRFDVRSSGIRSKVFAVQGEQGRLLSVEDNLTSGTLFSVSNITGLSYLEVDTSGKVDLAEFGTEIIAHKPIEITNYTPINTTNKLYNQSGVLFWSGNEISTSTGSGTPSGVAFFGADGLLTDNTGFIISSGDGNIPTQIAINGTPADLVDPHKTLSVYSNNSLNQAKITLQNNARGNSILDIIATSGSRSAGMKVTVFNSDWYVGQWSNSMGGLGSRFIVASYDLNPLSSIIMDSNGYVVLGSVSPEAKFHVNNTLLATETVSIFRGMAAQVGNLTEWQDSAGDVLTSVDNQGNVDISGTLRCNDIGITTGNLSLHVGGGSSAYFSFNNSLEYVMNAAHFRPNNLAKDLGTNTARWENFYVKNINTSGTTTFYKDNTSQIDVFYSGDKLAMELNGNGFHIVGDNGTSYIDFQDNGNGAVNVRRSLYPNGNKQTRFGFSTLRWQTLYGGNADLETYNVAVPTLALRNIGSQTADLTQWQDSSSNVLAYVDKDGHAHFPSLSVSGDFTYVNSENVTIFDKQIELASLSGSAVSGDALVDEGGFVLKSTDGDKQFIWRDQEDAWTSNQNITLDNKNLYIYTSGINTNSHERLTIGPSVDYFLFESRNTNQTLSGPFPPGLKFSTAGHVLFDLGYNKTFSLYFGGNSRGYIDKSTVKFNLSYQTYSVYPKTDSTYNLGTNLLYWNRVYARTLEARAAVGQTDNLTEWKDSAGDVLSSVQPDGSIHVSGNIVSESDGEIRSYILGKPGDTDTEYLRIGDLAGLVHSIQPQKTGSGQNRHIRMTSADSRGVLNLYSDGHLNYFFNSTQIFSAFHWGISVSGEIRSLGAGNAYLGQSTSPFVAGYLNDVYTSGVTTSGIYLHDNVPTNTNYQLYNDGGTLKWNGAEINPNGNPSGVAFFGGDGVLTDVTKLVYASGDDSDNLEHGFHIYNSGAGTANWERAEIGWGRTGGNAPGRFYIGLNEGGTGNNGKDIRIAGRIIDFKTGVNKANDILKLSTSEIVTYMRVVPGAPNTTADTLGHTTVPYGRLFLGDRDGSLRFNNDTFIHRPSSGVMVVTSGTNYENAVFRAGSFEAEGVHVDVVPLQVKGATGQSVDFAEFKDSTDEVRAAVNTDGRFVSHCTASSSHDIWFGHNSPTLASSQARVYASDTLFRSGSHGVNIGGSSGYGGVAASAGHTFGFSSVAITTPNGAIDAGIARTAKGHIRIIDNNSAASENLGDLTASGVHVSGVHLLQNIPDDRTDVIYNSGGTMTWDGPFAAETKSFLIDHPTREGMKLQYGSLEGPENGAYVRGATTSEIIELPDYWTGLVDEESITVQLTPKSHSQNTYVSGIMNNKVYLISDTDIDVYYNVYGTRKDVAPLEVEW